MASLEAGLIILEAIALRTKIASTRGKLRLFWGMATIIKFYSHIPLNPFDSNSFSL
ncbi:MAG: hypothetical protein QNJ65_15930 [Xenococcaceae cyanobacterium MO_234.B1]|nr:hypothetical protein [Xenococcaceae cyanobacterium MO_234.B1]